MPVPMALIMVRISLFCSILSMRAFSTLMILPRSGRMAWKLRSRAILAEPPAESPSTRYSSDRAADGILVAVDVADEIAHAAGVLERDRFAVGTFVDELDAQVLGEESRLA